MKVYKCFYMFQGSRLYLSKRDGTDVFVSLKGVKCCIAQREKSRRYYLMDRYVPEEYYIETYHCSFEKEEKAE